MMIAGTLSRFLSITIRLWRLMRPTHRRELLTMGNELCLLFFKMLRMLLTFEWYLRQATGRAMISFA